jgi:TolB protein
VTASPTGSPTPSLSPTTIPTQTPYVITATSPVDPIVAPLPQGLFVLSLDDSARQHLFAYAPQSLPLTRLTSGNDDDVTPALSPDGTRIAFASNRNGYWDLYLLDLASGQTSRLTDTPAFDGSPSWSPDNVWLTYESYADGNLEIFIRAVSDPAQVYRITTDASTDSSPAWSPQARQIAFVSNRSGRNEIWIADLDKVGDQRFSEVSQVDGLVPSHPAWSTDGRQLAWSATDPETGLTGIYVWNAQTPAVPARWLASGDWPVWQDGSHLVTRLTTPNQIFLTGYTVPHGEITLPTVQLPGSLGGLSYGVSAARLAETFQAAAAITPAPAYIPVLNPQPNVPAGRASLEPLPGVQAPYPELHDLVDESFQALRARVAADAGWDALGNLENAYVPLTAALDPGLGEDWLFTGRAFALNSSQLDAGWMVVTREDFGQQTYWRVFLRTYAQDGSQGAPLEEIPWDFSARAGDPKAYDDGGRLMTAVPAGYWIDLSGLALRFGWERLPALTNWRSYFKGARFNEFAMTQGMDWRSAMLELYPVEVLVTPTVIIPPTRTPTRTPRWYQSPTPTRTATPRPTYTP